MASVIVRNLSDATHRSLKRRAKQHGRSTEAEIRHILESAVSPDEKVGLGDRLAAFGRRFDGLELDIPARAKMPDPPKFE